MQLKVAIASVVLRGLHSQTPSSIPAFRIAERKEERILAEADDEIDEDILEGQYSSTFYDEFDEEEMEQRVLAELDEGRDEGRFDEDIFEDQYSSTTFYDELDGEEMGQEEAFLSRQLVYDEENKIESAHIYGNIHTLQYYYIDLMVGTPAQRISVIADTGSNLCGFPCVPYCKEGDCGKHMDPQFNMTKSENADLVNCDECNNIAGATCNSESQQCNYSMYYAEGSSIEGLYFTDTISFGDALEKNPALAIMNLGCHKKETNLFVTQKANGIIGLAPGRNGLAPEINDGSKTVLEALYGDKQHVNHKIFTMCLSSEGGILSVGGFDKTIHTGEIAPWLSMDLTRTFYDVDLRGVHLADGDEDTVLDDTTKFSYARVDSGTTFSFFPTHTFNAMVSKIREACEEATGCEIENDTCMGEKFVEHMPTFRFSVSEKKSDDDEHETTAYVNWEPSAYMNKEGKKDKYCFAAEAKTSNDVVFGASFMLNHDVIFDLEKEQIKFQKANCPRFTKRE